MSRLLSFDYTAPYYYLVTINAKQGMAPFSILTHETKSGIRKNPITRKMVATLYWMNQKAYAHRMQITNYAIMPNHLHLIIKIADGPSRVSLIEIVQKLYFVLSSAYYDGLNQPKGKLIFEEEWHDWIVMHANTLKVFTDYVMQNPHRRLAREQAANACFPRVYQTPSATWTCIGTLSPKETPVRAPVICSRSILPEHPLWQEWKTFAQRLGPGTPAVGTFMSPCEKMVREEVLKAGGGILHLLPRGISPKGHASVAEDALLTAGRLTLMTPFPFEARTLSAKELHDRCHTTLQDIARSLQRAITDIPPSR